MSNRKRRKHRKEPKAETRIAATARVIWGQTGKIFNWATQLIVGLSLGIFGLVLMLGVPLFLFLFFAYQTKSEWNYYDLGREAIGLVIETRKYESSSTDNRGIRHTMPMTDVSLQFSDWEGQKRTFTQSICGNTNFRKGDAVKVEYVSKSSEVARVLDGKVGELRGKMVVCVLGTLIFGGALIASCIYCFCGLGELFRSSVPNQYAIDDHARKELIAASLISETTENSSDLSTISTRPYLIIQECPSCHVVVVPMSDGKCPSCQFQLIEVNAD